MKRNDEGGLDLNRRERRILTQSIIAQRLASPADWLLWEDWPALSETEFQRVRDEAQGQINVLTSRHVRAAEALIKAASA